MLTARVDRELLNTYGKGLINLTRAFQPVGGLSAVSPTGAALTLGSSSNAVLSSPVLGSLKGLGAALANYTVFDGFSRNFTANLSSLISKPAGASVALSSLAYAPVWTNRFALADGGFLEVARDSRTNALEAAAQGMTSPWLLRPVDYVAYVAPSGLTLAGGYGLSPSAHFSRALWGERNPPQAEAGQALNALATGGYSASFGLPLGDNLRLAGSWTRTPDHNNLSRLYAYDSRSAQASQVGAAAGEVSAGVGPAQLVRVAIRIAASGVW